MKRKSSIPVVLCFILPAVLILTAVIIVPFFQGVSISFTNWNGLSKDYDYIGLKNLFLLFKDKNAANAAKNTLIYTAIISVGVNLLALVLAVALDSNVAGKRFLKSAMFMPIVISMIVTSFIWSRVFGDVLPTYFSVRSPLSSTKWALYAIAFICLWRDTGLCMVIYNAGLQSIPAELYDAAKVDGANWWQRFKGITFPMLAPAFTTCVTLWIGYGLKVYDYPMAATGGGPGTASETFALYVYKNFFTNNRAGYGQMAAIVMLVVVVTVTSLVTKALRKREVEL